MDIGIGPFNSSYWMIAAVQQFECIAIVWVSEAIGRSEICYLHREWGCQGVKEMGIECTPQPWISKK